MKESLSNEGLKKSSRKKIGVMDIVLIYMAVMILIFTIVMIYMFDAHEAIPDTLCTCVFGLFSTECGVMALIKSTGLKYKQNDQLSEVKAIEYVPEEEEEGNG